MRPKGKRMLAWLLATTVTLSGNSFTVLADELDFTDAQEVHEEETTEEQAAQDENATAEIQIQDDFQSEEIEEPVVEEAEEPQIEETEESEITAEEVDEEIQHYFPEVKKKIIRIRKNIKSSLRTSEMTNTLRISLTMKTGNFD